MILVQRIILAIFFPNISSNLKIPEYANCDPILGNIIVKYRDHLSIHKIGDICNRQQEQFFSFSHVDKEPMLKDKSKS